MLQSKTCRASCCIFTIYQCSNPRGLLVECSNPKQTSCWMIYWESMRLQSKTGPSSWMFQSKTDFSLNLPSPSVNPLIVFQSKTLGLLVEGSNPRGGSSRVPIQAKRWSSSWIYQASSDPQVWACGLLINHHKFGSTGWRYLVVGTHVGCVCVEDVGKLCPCRRCSASGCQFGQVIILQNPWWLVTHWSDSSRRDSLFSFPHQKHGLNCFQCISYRPIVCSS